MRPENLSIPELLRHVEQDYADLLRKPVREAWKIEPLAALLTRAHERSMPPPDTHNELKQRRKEIDAEIRDLEQQIEDLQDEADEVDAAMEQASNIEPFKYCEWCDRPLEELTGHIYGLSQLELIDP